MSADDHPSRRRFRRPPPPAGADDVRIEPGGLLRVNGPDGQHFHAIVFAVHEFPDGHREIDCVNDLGISDDVEGA